MAGVAAAARDPATIVSRLGDSPNLLAVALDVTDASQARAAAQAAVARFGRIDILLNNAGFGLLGAVEEATGGAQALEKFFLNRPDLVLLDMVMNGMYGLDVLTKLKELDPGVRVIVATADVQKSTREQAKAGGAAGFVNKPLDAAKLRELIAKVLEGADTWI